VASGGAAVRREILAHYRPRCQRHRGAGDADGRRGAVLAPPGHPARVDHVRAGGATPWRPSAAAGRGGAPAGRHCGAPAAAIGSAGSYGKEMEIGLKLSVI